MAKPGLVKRLRLTKVLINKTTLPFIKRRGRGKAAKMLWTIFVILLVMWLLGMVSSYTLGGFIHILLVIALVVLLLRIISGRRVAL